MVIHVAHNCDNPLPRTIETDFVDLRAVPDERNTPEGPPTSPHPLAIGAGPFPGPAPFAFA